MTRQRWTQDEEEFLQNNYHKMSASEIADKIGRTPASVRSKARHMEISNINQRILNRAHEIDTPNFEKDFSYFVSGFVAGEGSFYYNSEIKEHSFGISANSRDSKIIEEIYEFFGCVGSIFTQDKSGVSGSMRRISIRSVGDIAAVIIPFFEKYPMKNTHKQQQYEDWRDYLYETYNIEPIVNRKI